MEFNIRLFIRFFSNFLEGYGVTIQYAVVGIILSLIAGLVIGLTLCLRPAVATPILRGYITFFRETPLLVQMYLLYYVFFSFAVVRQISIDTFLKVPLLLLVTLFLLQLLYRYIL